MFLPSTLWLVLKHAEAGLGGGGGDARSHLLPAPGDSSCSERELKPGPACRTRIHVSWAPTVCFSHPFILLSCMNTLKTGSEELGWGWLR